MIVPINKKNDLKEVSIMTKPTGREPSLTSKGKLEEEALNKVTGGEGRTPCGYGSCYCPMAEDDYTLKHYLFYSGIPNGCPHWKGKCEDSEQRCRECVYLENS